VWRPPGGDAVFDPEGFALTRRAAAHLDRPPQSSRASDGQRGRGRGCGDGSGCRAPGVLLDGAEFAGARAQAAWAFGDRALSETWVRGAVYSGRRARNEADPSATHIRTCKVRMQARGELCGVAPTTEQRRSIEYTQAQQSGACMHAKATTRTVCPRMPTRLPSADRPQFDPTRRLRHGAAKTPAPKPVRRPRSSVRVLGYRASPVVGAAPCRAVVLSCWWRWRTGVLVSGCVSAKVLQRSTPCHLVLPQNQ